MDEEESQVILSKLDHADVADRLAILRIQEETTYHIKDYLTESAAHRKRATKPVDADCRIKMCEWCFQVVDFCRFKRETVSIGMSYLDRYLCTPKGRSALCNRKEYQLAAMTALYVAIKLHEPLEMETSLLADLSRGCYTEMEFVEMEQVLLQAVKWRVNGPTVLAFLAHLWALLPSAVHQHTGLALYEYARFQTELAIAEQTLVFTKPSELALAAILNALEGLDDKLFSSKARSKFIKYMAKYAEMNVTTKIEKLQAKLSMATAVAVLQQEWDTLDPNTLTRAAAFQAAMEASSSKKKSSSSSSSSSKRSSSATTSSSSRSNNNHHNNTATSTNGSSESNNGRGTSVKHKSPVSVIDEAEPPQQQQQQQSEVEIHKNDP